WIRHVNQFGFTVLGQYMQILDDLVVYTDFDSLDTNLTTMRTINHNITTRYFEHIPRRTGCAWFDVVHSFNTTEIQLEEKYKAYEDMMNYYRVQMSFAYNAFNFIEAYKVAMLGATFYPIHENSTESTWIGVLAHIIGHEIYHSFVREELQNRSVEYKSEVECLQQHYNQSCQLFAETECNSGNKTLSEDGSDVEG
ncbi:hypothetical protein PMAYCL1PPCAC_32564, partial [Pristionchus mayeri]